MNDFYLDREIEAYTDQPQDLDERDILIIAEDYDLTDKKQIVLFANEIIQEWKDNNQYGTC
jgi:hypothetical protein